MQAGGTAATAPNWSVGDAFATATATAVAAPDKERERSPNRDVFRVSVFEMDKNGIVSREFKSVCDIVRLRDETRLPIRDLRLFFQNGSRGSTGANDSNPAIIITRPSSNSFLLNLEHVRLLCRKDIVTILNPDEAAVQSFVSMLKDQVKAKTIDHSPNPGGLRHDESSVHIFLAALADQAEPNFEIIVLESALAEVTNKFQRRLNLLKPMLDVLLHETSTNPNASMLRRMLALRKSLNSFMTSVKSVLAAVNGVLRSDHNMFGGRRLSISENEFEAEELELLLEAYSSELKEIEHELRNVDEQIEDTNDFINIHLNSIRNRIIKLSLYIEAGTLCIGLCALVTGFFGMNLRSGLEESETGFVLTCCLTLVFGGSLFGIFVNRYSQIQEDASSAKDYQNIKHFFTYVDSVESTLGDLRAGNVNGSEFRKLLESVVGPSLTIKESESITRLLDVCKKLPTAEATPYSTITAANNFHLLRVANASHYRTRPSVVVHESDDSPAATHKRMSQP